MPMLFLFCLYQVIQLIFFPVIIFILLVTRFKKGRFFGDFGHRFGFVPRAGKEKSIVWVHGVSVGEILSVEYLIKEIEKSGKTTCYVTTGTQGGMTMVRQRMKPRYSAFFPFDFLPCVLLAFVRIRPIKIIIVEAEIWPNVLMVAHFFRIPVYLVNARLSARSFPRYQKLTWIFRPLFNVFEKIFTQSQRDKELFTQLGVAGSRVEVWGNLKAYNVIKKYEDVMGCGYERIHNNVLHNVLLVGSIHPGELQGYLELYKQLKPEFLNLKLILALRHFTWKKELQTQVATLGVSTFMWDEGQGDINVEKVLQDVDILLACKLGILFDLYRYTNIFYLGGTFVPVGGHNLLEPAVWGLPSLVGPYHGNCRELVDVLVQAGGLIKVDNIPELIEQTRLLLRDVDRINTMGGIARGVIEREALAVEGQLKKYFLDQL